MKGSFLRQKLFCPGPVNLADNVKLATIRNEIGHREKEFSKLLKDIQKKLLIIAGVDRKNYHAVLITGSGTAANEAILSSVVGEKRILVISNGEFGERLYKISSIHNKNTHLLKFQWAEKIDLNLLKHHLAKEKFDIVAMVHHETSTGMLNPISKIAKIVKTYKAMFIVDMISSFGAEPINIGKEGIDFASGSASKAIASLPGVSFVIGKKSQFEKLKDITSRTSYLDLYTLYRYSKDYSQTPNTPAVQSFFALDMALTNIIEEGFERRCKKIKRLSNTIREGLKKMNLITLIEKKDMSSSLTTFILPKNIHIDDLKAKLRERNIIIYNGKGLLAGKVFQVANIGNLNEYDVAYFLKSMEAALIDLGHFGLLNKNNIHTMNIHAPEDSLLRESKKVNVDNFYTTSQ